MSYYVHFTPLNADFFVQKEAVFAFENGYVPYGRGLDKDYTKDHQLSRKYERLTSADARQCIYLLRGRVGTFEWNYTNLNICDENGNVLKNLENTGGVDSCGITDPVTGDDLDAQVFQFRISDYSELNGYNKLIFEIVVAYGDGADLGTGTTNTYIADTLWVADSHDVNTCYIEVSHDKNKNGVLFEQLKPTFAYTIDSYGLTEGLAGEYTAFQTESNKTVNMYGASYPVFDLDIGGRHGNPFFVLDALDNALNLKYIRIDGARYTRLEHDLQHEGMGKSRHWGTAKLAAYDNDDYRTFRRGTLQLYKRPDTYPFAVSDVWVSNGFGAVGIFDGRVIDDEIDDDMWVSELNGYAIAESVNGTFEYADGYMTFTNADDEDLHLKGTCVVYHNCLTGILNVPNALDKFRWVLQYGTVASEPHVVCFGGLSSDETAVYYASGGVASRTYEYGASGNYTIRIFTRDLERGYTFNQSTSYPVQITNISGTISTNTQTVGFEGHDFSALTTLDLSFLSNAKNQLLYLTLKASKINGITSGWASNLVSLPYKPFSRLQYIDATNNTFTSANVDSYINEFYNSCAVQSGYNLFAINGNTPSAPPTAASSASRSGLSAAFWTVVTATSPLPYVGSFTYIYGRGY
jgi:hypothetical protein